MKSSINNTSCLYGIPTEMMTIMQQYEAATEANPGCLLLFRMGDFYEAFYRDAQELSKRMGLTLCHRDRDRKIPMVGFPYHQLDGYVRKLQSHGIKVVTVEL